jgi:hypothetical protein
MPLRRFLPDHNSFSPEELAVLSAAFAEALDKLGLNDRNDPLVEIVAKRIINGARAGERDRAKLCAIGMKDGAA